jgi:hypothetical protein
MVETLNVQASPSKTLILQNIDPNSRLDSVLNVKGDLDNECGASFEGETGSNQNVRARNRLTCTEEFEIQDGESRLSIAERCNGSLISQDY